MVMSNDDTSTKAGIPGVRPRKPFPDPPPKRKPDGGPAFPTMIGDDFGEWRVHGMTLRDYFAGQALAGLVTTIKSEKGAALLVRASYVAADAMLAEREKEATP